MFFVRLILLGAIMLEKTGNLWTFNGVTVITTNGFVKSDWTAVMGRGCALEAMRRYPNIEYYLGSCIRKFGNHCYRLAENLVSFPVKPRSSTTLKPVRHMANKVAPGQSIPGWACVADINLIERSAHELVTMANKFDWEQIFLPRPGCGAGELSWATVRPILADIFDDRFVCVTYR